MGHWEVFDYDTETEWANINIVLCMHVYVLPCMVPWCPQCRHTFISSELDHFLSMHIRNLGEEKKKKKDYELLQNVLWPGEGLYCI